MAIRLYPDFAVAVILRDSISREVYLAEHAIDEIVDTDKLRDILGHILIHPKACVEIQRSFLNNGISNVFIGYGHSQWTTNDYEAFLNEQPQLFERKFFPNDERKFYKINEDKIKQVTARQTPQQMMQKLCMSILVEGAYSPLVLKKYGFIGSAR